MTNRRYTSTTFVPPTAPQSVVETPRYGFPPDRQPVNVAATLAEHVAVAAAWAGVIVAGGLLVELLQRVQTIAFWPAVWRLAGITWLVVVCVWTTWHFSQDEWMRRHDRRAWIEMEMELAETTHDLQEALNDNGKLREEMRILRVPVGGKGDQAGRTMEAEAPAAEMVSPVAQAVGEQRREFEAAVREIVRRFELGLDYDRESMVKAGVVRPSVWNVVMKEMQRKGVAKARGQGGRLQIVAYRGEDVLRAMDV